MLFADQHAHVRGGGHFPAQVAVVGGFLVAQFHHARRHDDAPSGEAAQHVQGGLGADGIAVEGVVDDRNAPGAGKQLQTMLHRLQLAHAPLDLVDA